MATSTFSGGGVFPPGGSINTVQTVPQSLSPTQQAQAISNLGLTATVAAAAADAQTDAQMQSDTLSTTSAMIHALAPTVDQVQYFTQLQQNQLQSNIGIGSIYAKAQTGNFTLTIPANCVLDGIVIINTTANAVTGGIKVGTTSGGTDVVAAQAVGANALVSVADVSILKRVFSISASQTLFIQAVTAWNSASLNVYFTYQTLV